MTIFAVKEMEQNYISFRYTSFFFNEKHSLGEKIAASESKFFP